MCWASSAISSLKIKEKHKKEISRKVRLAQFIYVDSCLLPTMYFAFKATKQ